MDSKTPLKLRLGVIAADSNFVPFLAKDMLAALEFGLAQSRLDAELIIESAGFNADSKMIVPAIQRLSLASGVDCIIAPLNVSLIEKQASHFESRKLPLVALNLTEDPLFETARNPFVFVNSFFLWQTAWMSGYLAGQRFGARGAVMVPLHEGGYGLMFAFQLGLEAAQGELVKAVITHRNSSSEDPTESIAEVSSHNPDFIWAAYSGKEAVSLFEAFRKTGLQDKIPLMTIPTTVSQNICQSAGDAAHGVWYVTQENPAPEDSINLLAQTLGREPNPYALLAYEAISMIAAAVRRAGETANFAESFPALLQQSQFQSHRGLIGFNKYSAADTFYLRRINEGADSFEKIVAPPLLDEQYLLACKRLFKEGWVNPYLCA